MNESGVRGGHQQAKRHQLRATVNGSHLTGSAFAGHRVWPAPRCEARIAGAAFVVLAAGDIFGAGLALLICVMGVLLLGFGVVGPARHMDAWADAASGHEVALVLMVLAYPVYLC